MKQFTFLIIAIFCGDLIHAQKDSDTVFLIHVNVVDVIKGTIIPDMNISISKYKIIKVGSFRSVQVPRNVKVLDCTGKYMIPGLWDMHVHLGDATTNSFPLFIANGVTGVRDMGTLSFDSIRKWRVESLTGKRIGPRIIGAGPILDGGPIPVLRVLVNNPSEGREAVDSLVRVGVDFIKVHQHLNKKTYIAIADEASKLNIPFAGHVPSTDIDYLVSGTEASNAGQKSLEHMMGIPFYGDTIVDLNKLFKTLNKNKTYITPTLYTYWISAHREDSIIRNDSRMKYVPPVLKEWWEKQMAGWSEKYKDVRQYVLSARMKMIPLLRDAGVSLLAGTDLGVAFVYPGSGLHDELKLLVKAGLSPAQALRTATINPAIYFNMEKESGTIEEGKLADLVLLDKNPLNDINNIDKISVVIFNGTIYRSADIYKIFEGMEDKTK
jgi:imidazolonepropionase-like amidohydrolase